jgi:hypothetical protein
MPRTGSDGDNWADDSPLCHELLAKKILPVVRYYSYIEITRRTRPCAREYEHLQATFDNFAMQHIRDQEDIIRCSGSCSTSNLLPATHNPTASEPAGCVFFDLRSSRANVEPLHTGLSPGKSL